MKVKLLKICRRKITFYERNGKYYVDTGEYLDPDGKTKKQALEYYRFWILETAKNIFGFKPKNILYKP